MNFVISYYAYWISLFSESLLKQHEHVGKECCHSCEIEWLSVEEILSDRECLESNPT